MKKHFVFFLLFAFIQAINANAQLVVNSVGQVVVGNDAVDVTSQAGLPAAQCDTVTAIKVIGWNDDNGSGARISFGNQPRLSVNNVMVGEYGSGNSDQLWLHGRRGVYVSTGDSCDLLMRYDRNLDSTYLYINSAVTVDQLMLTSDRRFKEDVQTLRSSLEALGGVNGVSYRYRDGGAAMRTRNNVSNDVVDRNRHYGFIAQDIEQVFPELVFTDSRGYKYVDYIGMIPLLVNAVNELSARLETYESGVAQGSVTGVGDVGTGAVVARLYQNQPNPFSSETVIRCSLPESVAQATIYVYDMQGKQIKSVEVSGRGETSATISGSELEAGMYIYALIADGREIDSKRMILTK